MKPIVSIFLGTVVACGAMSLCARADEVDDLLNLDPAHFDATDVGSLLESTPSDTSLQSNADRAGRAAVTDSGTRTEARVPQWLPMIGAAAAGDLAAHSAAVAASPKSAEPTSVSLVPEPSAVALAIAALVYFLIFGRRRQVL